MASYGGKGVKFLNNPTNAELIEFFDNLEEENLIFQETIKQSKEECIYCHVRPLEEEGFGRFPLCMAACVGKRWENNYPLA